MLLHDVCIVLICVVTSLLWETTLFPTIRMTLCTGKGTVCLLLCAIVSSLVMLAVIWLYVCLHYMY